MLIFCIQYDELDSTHVFTYHCEATDVRKAIQEFDKHYHDQRILSIELLPRSKVNDFEYRLKTETQMRDRAIRGLI